MTEITVVREKTEVVPSFCYLGNCLSAGGGCEHDAIIGRRVAWGQFNEFLPILTSRSFPITSRWRVYISMQAEPGPQPHRICIPCNATTRLWSVVCAVLPLRNKPVHKISWTGWNLTIWRGYPSPVDWDGITMSNLMIVGWRKSWYSIR